MSGKPGINETVLTVDDAQGLTDLVHIEGQHTFPSAGFLVTLRADGEITFEPQTNNQPIVRHHQ